MDVVRTLRALSPRSGDAWGAVVSGLGVVFGAIEFAHVRAMSTPFGIAVEAVLPFVGAVGLVAAGYVLWTQRYGYVATDVPRVVGWTVVGMGAMGLIFLWILSHQLVRGGTFHHAHFILVNNLIVGALIGFVVGTYDARSRVYRRSIRREQLKHEFLNRELRHHVLNGMNVILGQVERLDERPESTPPEAIDAIRRRGEEIVDRIESVRTIARAFADAETVRLDRRDLSAVLTDVAGQADDRYEGVVVSTDVPEDRVTVYADRFLPAVFENLLSNAIERADGGPSRVRVSLAADAETAVVRIADDGPGTGIPGRGTDSFFTWQEPTDGRNEAGIDLAIVNVLVDRYGGRVWTEDGDTTGTVACVELARAA